MKGRSAWLFGVAAAATSVAPQAALAQDAATDEIVVTARKVEERLQEAPLSVAAFSGDELLERGIDDLTELARSTPGFSFENYNGGFPVPTIRGQSQARLTNPVQNVATFYNGVYLPRSYIVDASLLNIGRVEVLRGPQSAALGRSAFAGAVNFVSRTPGDEFHADAQASAGENEYRRYDVSIDGPIAPGFVRGMLGYSFSEYDGAWENRHVLANAPGGKTQGKLGGYESESFMIGLNVEPIEALSINLTYLSSDRTVETPGSYTFSSGSLDAPAAGNLLNCSPNAAIANRNMLFCGTIPVLPVIAAGETRKSGLVIDPRTGIEISSDIFSASVDYTFNDAFSLHYLFGHVEGDFKGAGSTVRNQEAGWAAFGGSNFIDTTGNGSVSGDSHEVRLAYAPNEKFSSYVGGYWSTTDDATRFNLQLAPGPTTQPLSPTTPLTGPGNEGNSVNTADISSIFAFIEYKTGPWSFSAEGRQTREEITEESRLAPASRATVAFDYFTPRVTVMYNFTDNNRLYASYARGVKAGGFNIGGSNSAAFANPAEATFDPETNDTYEIGSRNELLDGALTLNLTAYRIESSDLQVSRARTGSLTQTVIANLASAETFGAELEMRLQASDSLNLYGGVGYANAEYGSDVIDVSVVRLGLCAANTVCRSTGAIGGNRLERAPEWNANLGFSWDHALTDQVNYYIRGDVGYVGEQFANNLNTAVISERTIVNGSVGLTRGKWEARLSADNLFDEQYVSSAFLVNLGTSPFFFNRAVTPNLGDRRRVAFSVAYRY